MSRAAAVVGVSQAEVIPAWGELVPEERIGRVRPIVVGGDDGALFIE